MVLDDLLSALVARLEEDTVFSDPTEHIPVIAENRMDLLNESEVAIAKLGLLVLVSVISVTPSEGGSYNGGVMITVMAQAHEVPAVNRARAESESKLTAQQTLMLVKALWDRPWTPDPDAFSTLYFSKLDLTDADEATGRVTWTLEMQVFTFLETDHETVRITEESDARGTEEDDDRVTQ